MKLTPLPNELAVDLKARQAIEDCANKYIASTGPSMLTGTMQLARASGSQAVFDLNAAHAEGVLNAIALKTGKPKGHAIANDVMAVILLNNNGVAAGSPVPADKMTLIPADPVAYAAFVAQIQAAFTGIAGMGFTVVDV